MRDVRQQMRGSCSPLSMFITLLAPSGARRHFLSLRRLEEGRENPDREAMTDQEVMN